MWLIFLNHFAFDFWFLIIIGLVLAKMVWSISQPSFLLDHKKRATPPHFWIIFCWEWGGTNGMVKGTTLIILSNGMYKKWAILSTLSKLCGKPLSLSLSLLKDSSLSLSCGDVSLSPIYTNSTFLRCGGDLWQVL